MFRKPLLLLAVTLALSNFALAQEAPEYGPAKGTLLIIGGGNLNGSGIYEQFIELAGGKDKKFVIVPTAGGNKNADGSLRCRLLFWKQLGKPHIRPIATVHSRSKPIAPRSRRKIHVSAGTANSRMPPCRLNTS